MLIVAYVINFSLVSASGGDARNCAGITLISFTLILTTGNIVWIVYQFIEFSGCPGNIAIMVITCVIGFIMYALVLLRTRHDASIFTSSLVLTYFLYL
jgi:Serine incorporator (Serinc)